MSDDTLYNSLSGILNRDEAIVYAKAAIDKYSAYLRDIVNYSTNLLARCEQSLKTVRGAPVSLIHLYYHAIQMTDGIEVLASNACFVAAAPLHRSLMEAALSIDYILEDDFEGRSVAWIVASYLDRRAFFESLDGTTSKGKELSAKLKNDKIIGPDFDVKVDMALLKQQLEEFDNQLNKPKFAAISKKFRENKSLKKWYQIDEGPRDLFNLAKALRRPMEYETFYRIDSAILHACDSEKMLSKDKDLYMTPIRPGKYGLSVEALYVSTGAFLNLSSLAIAGKLRQEEAVEEDIRRILLRHRPELFTRAK